MSDTDNGRETAAQIRIGTTAKRIRAQLAGMTVGDSVRARLAYVTGHHPEYLLPVDDIDWTALEGGIGDDVPARDDMLGSWTPLRAAGATIGRRYHDGAASGLVCFDFAAMGAWFEEDEQIFFHPRDPYRRVDVTESSRRVEITVDGHLVAATDRPRLVTETALPARWYVPRTDVDWALLSESGTTSACQYKGVADWFHVDLPGGERLADVAWGYERPVPEAPKLAGLVAFYAEHSAVETTVDGIAQTSPSFDPSWINPSLGIENVDITRTEIAPHLVNA